MDKLTLIKYGCAGVLMLVVIALQVISMLLSKKSKGEKVTCSDVIGAVVSSPVNTIIEEFLPQYMSEAEELKIAGPVKKVIALSKVTLKCSELGIDYNAYAQVFSDAIENLIKLTKSVNAKDKTEGD